MNVIDHFAERGLTLSVDGDRLIVRPKERITDEVRDFIREHKAEILETMLGNAPSCPDPPSGHPVLPFGEGTPENGTIPVDSPDAVAIGERIGIKYENETPENLGEPVLIYKGVPLSWSGDLPHVRLFAWDLVHLHPGQALTLDYEKAARDCKLTVSQVRGAIARLVKDGDIVEGRGRGLYRLVINYSGGTP